MPKAVVMPVLSPTMVEGHLVKWHKKEGDAVSQGDVLFEIETDKAVMEVEAPHAGVLARILIPEKTEGVPIRTLVGVIKSKGDSDDDVNAFVLAEQAKAKSSSVKSVEEPSLPTAQDLLKETFHDTRIAASPLARKIAAQHGIDLSTVVGSGPRGRIIKEDIERKLDMLSGYAIETGVTESENTTMMVSKDGHNEIFLTPTQKIIAERMSLSKKTIPHFYLAVDCRMDALISLRSALNETRGENKISMNDMFVRACALALSETPELNGHWHEDRIRRGKTVDLAVAVSLPGGEILTPVARDAARKSVSALSEELRDLIKRAREKKLSSKELQGGTFTLSNVGTLGIDRTFSIINPPQLGILGIGACLKKPVIEGDKIVVGRVMTVTLSADHRAVSGEEGGRFLTLFRTLIETPLRLLS